MINLIPEASSAPPAAKRRYARRSTVLSVLLAAAVIGSAIASKSSAAASLGVGLYAVAVVTLAAIIYEFVTLMRALDELQIRIHLTALATGFGASSVFVTMGGLATAFLDGAFGDWLILLSAVAMPGGIVGYIVVLLLVQGRYR